MAPMKSFLFAVCSLALVGVPSDVAAQERTTLVILQAKHVRGHVLEGMRFAYLGVETPPTGSAGVTDLELGATHTVGQTIQIVLADAPGGAGDWMIVDDTLAIPSPNSPVDVILMRHAEFFRLSDTATDRIERAQQGNRELSESERQAVIAETAAEYGLSEELFYKALSTFGESEDPAKRGVALFLSGQYPEAEASLATALDQRAERFVETALYLARAQREQAKYEAAIASAARGFLAS